MYPRLYMHSIQYTTYNCTEQKVTFETRYACGRRCYFHLSKNQFLSFNDAILLIDRLNSYGHYPLGQRTWFHYNLTDASLYRNFKNGDRVDFTFASFAEYKKYAHRRLLSLVRLKEDEAVTTTATAVVRTKSRRKQHDGEGRGRGRGRSEKELKIVSSCHKRSLPNTLREQDRSPASKRHCRKERETVSRSSDNADVSYNDEESPVFSEWHSSNNWRRCDRLSSLSSVSENLCSVGDEQFSSSSNFIDEMETQ